MPDPWATPHELSLHKQTEERPGGDGWMERQGSGLVHVLCNCGYSTGWIPREQMPSRDELAEHGAPLPGATETAYGPRPAVVDWLRANGIDPDEVPLDAAISIEPLTLGGDRCIRYEVLLRDDTGHRYVDESTGEAARVMRTAPLTVEPPTNVQIPASL